MILILNLALVAPALGTAASAGGVTEVHGSPGVVIVQPLDPDVDLSSLGPEYDKRKLSDLAPAPSQLPVRSVRDSLFTQAGLADFVAPLDDLDRDLLYLDLARRTPEEILKRHPGLESSRVQNIKKLIRDKGEGQ